MNNENSLKEVYKNNEDIEAKEFDVNYPGEGLKVRIFDLEKGLVEYEHIKVIRIVSETYNLLIMQDYLSIIGEIDGSFEIEIANDKFVYKDVKAYYINNDDVFNIILGSML